jgi:mannose-6-phosphate isomerase-like protein (cupin superfamily)
MDKPRAGLYRSSVIPADEGEPLEFAGVAGRLKIDGIDTGERFAVAHFPGIPPHTLAAPLHLHHNEDEYSCVLAGTLTVLLGELVVTADAGAWVVKPRGQWHTFWNAGDQPCQTIEIVSPAGFQRYFREIAALDGNMSRLAQLNAKYSIDMEFDSVPDLCRRFGLTFPM